MWETVCPFLFVVLILPNVVDDALLNNCFSQNYDLFLVYCVEADMTVRVSAYRLTVSGCSCKWPYHSNLMLYAIRTPL